MKKLNVLLLLPLALLPAGGAIGQEAEGKILSEIVALRGECRNVGRDHLAALERVPRPNADSRRESTDPAGDHQLELDQKEDAFLRQNDVRIRVLNERVIRVESALLSVPPARQSGLYMEAFRSLCRLATTTIGRHGMDELRRALAISMAPEYDPYFPRDSEEEATASGGAAGRARQAPERDRVHPDPGPVSQEEYQARKERWDAHLREQELRELQDLQRRQAAIDAQKAPRRPPAEEPKEAKLTLRKDLPPAESRETPEQVAAKTQMLIWYDGYVGAVTNFKLALGQVMATHPSRKIARRDACGALATSLDALIKGRGLAAPDPAVAAPAQAMAVKFRAAAEGCLMEKQADFERAMREAEQELGKLAAALAPHGFTP